MVLASILGLGISLVPCLLFGLIMMISFLLCNCEYIGETVAKHFCAWKNRRKTRLKRISSSSRNNKDDSFTSGNGIVKGSQNTSTTPAEVNLAFVNMQKTNQLYLQMNNEPSAPLLHSQSHSNSSNVVTHDDGSNDIKNITGANTPSHSKLIKIQSDEELDPPPSYYECIRNKKME